MIRKKKVVHSAFASSASHSDADKSPAIPADGYDDALLYFNISAWSGVGGVNLTLEASPDDGTTWHTMSVGDGTAYSDMFYQSGYISSVGARCYRIRGPFGPLVRVAIAIILAPTVTFSVDLELTKRGD